ncbi:hypothetical protein NDU88_010827 [Pleurodeles waltl]|uniref:Uncharacterized protein n=1 Tax=Pleurodeles waltl TaxID=8319 RepID=A0AAV7PWC7_PLEWA|nr:hypothetical protein NDU88_010827 [Pleurodeles waltl]
MRSVLARGASSGALSDLRVGVSRVSFPGAPSQGASPVLFLDPDQVTGVPLSFSPQGVRGKHGSAKRSGASRFGSSLGTRLFYGLRSPRVKAQPRRQRLQVCPQQHPASRRYRKGRFAANETLEFPLLNSWILQFCLDSVFNM